MAAYQIAGASAFMFRAFGFCLPEVVVALYRSEESRLALKRFCLSVGLTMTAAMVILSVTGIDALLFRHVIGADPGLLPVARAMFVAVSLAPLLDSVQAYIRGVLTAHHLTMSRMAAVVVSTVVLIGAVQLAVRMGWPGPALAGVALTASLLAEYGILVFSWAKAKPGREAVRSFGS
jgi:O-antigen/teichoic acid export membrane protein